MTTRFKSVLAAGIVAAALTAHAGATNWAQFRGPGGCGTADGQGLPDRWSATDNVAWKTDLAGRGWSSPIVWGDRVYLTTVATQGEIEPPKKGLYFGGEREGSPELANQYKVLALDLQTGRVLWERTVHEGKPPFGVHVKNSFASETPVTDGEHVYALFGNVGLWCLDKDGNTAWSKPIEPRKTPFSWGTAASPVLHEGRLYLVNDNLEGSYIQGLDAKTGDEVWRVAREEKGNWSTPFVWVNEKRTEIVTAGSGLVRSYDLVGNLLWSLKGMSRITIATPYAAEGMAIVSSGYVGSKLRPLYAIRPGATGDITPAPGQTSNEWIAWSNNHAPYNPTTLGYNGRVYVLHDSGKMVCINAKDGAVLYEGQQIPDGKGFTSSPWAYDGKIFCLNEDGVTFVIKAGDTFEFLHSNPLGQDDMGMATPALAGDRLLLRTSARLYCIRNQQ